MGRPLLYAVAVGGEALVSATLESLIAEIDRTMAQLGCTDITELHSGLLHHARN
ncbi:alpha-hydroxy-acid oxidizing protein [Klebsiella pneumoniae]|uniref:alpha-hydroxy-acid oxidizing protein n=1 Tax=Klebsiella pneumoniae TaxID=573 RepID=UPI001D182DBC|nr:alpha-hydroxy-acid oxidizing protein [Klebsiella pneumoniae]